MVEQSHASRLNQATRTDVPPAVCGAPHPLLADVRCQRLKKHPGSHGSSLEDESPVEMTMEWEEPDAR